jgi:hypothetical protein
MLLARSPMSRRTASGARGENRRNVASEDKAHRDYVNQLLLRDREAAAIRRWSRMPRKGGLPCDGRRGSPRMKSRSSRRDGVSALHQKRRRRPCDHRGSSAVDAAVCELRIEALATVPMGHSRAPRFGSSGVLPSAEIRSKASAGEDGLVLLSDWAASSTVPKPSGSRSPASADRDASNSSNSALSNSSTQTAARMAMR